MKTLHSSALILIAILGLSPTAGAATFIIDTQQSALTLSGNATFTAGCNNSAAVAAPPTPIKGNSAGFSIRGSSVSTCPLR